jgi:hypothetical protein
LRAEEDEVGTAVPFPPNLNLKETCAVRNHETGHDRPRSRYNSIRLKHGKRLGPDHCTYLCYACAKIPGGVTTPEYQELGHCKVDRLSLAKVT